MCVLYNIYLDRIIMLPPSLINKSCSTSTILCGLSLFEVVQSLSTYHGHSVAGVSEKHSDKSISFGLCSRVMLGWGVSIERCPIK